jgi:hypothetical protein
MVTSEYAWFDRPGNCGDGGRGHQSGKIERTGVPKHMFSMESLYSVTT